MRRCHIGRPYDRGVLHALDRLSPGVKEAPSALADVERDPHDSLLGHALSEAVRPLMLFLANMLLGQLENYSFLSLENWYWSLMRDLTSEVFFKIK